MISRLVALGFAVVVSLLFPSAGLAEPSSPAADQVRQPTVTPSATALPTLTSTAVANTSIATAPSPAQANRSSGGNLRIQLPLIQHASAATWNEHTVERLGIAQIVEADACSLSR